ncbi:hypothetical protein LINGRAHAP2_LOCUS15913, partial [Linum grandiflorum]
TRFAAPSHHIYRFSQPPSPFIFQLGPPPQTFPPVHLGALPLKKKMSDSDRGIGYWLQWQVAICGFIIFAPGVTAAVYLIKKNLPPEAESAEEEETIFLTHLWKPCWRFLNPLWLLAFRVFALFCLAPVLYAAVASDGFFAFFFYTQWTFTLVMVYFALATAISVYGCYWESRKQPSAGAQNGEEASLFIERGVEDHDKVSEIVQLKPGFWGYLLLIMYQTCGGAVILTDIVFWGLLLPFQSGENFQLNMLMGCIHSMNAVFLILDTALNSLPFPWFRFAYFVLWSSLYIVFQWVIHACGISWWPYAFLELNTPWAPLWYFGMALVHVPCYTVYVLVVKAKHSVLRKWSY